MLASTVTLALALILGSGGIAHAMEEPVCPPRWVETFSGEDGGVNNTILDMLVWDDGSGPAIFVAGFFTEAGGEPAGRVAKWDGTAWSPLGVGVNGVVRALAVYDDGDGETIYAAGQFSHSGETEVANIAKWTGSAWVPLGPGLNNSSWALGVFDDGDGPELYASVGFTIAKWDGTTWSDVGGGTSGIVHAFEVFDDGNGPALYVGGTFSSVGDGIAANRVAKWDGSTWSPLGEGVGGANVLKVYDDGDKAVLLAGGGSVAQWDGESWSVLGEGIGGTSTVHALEIYDDGMGSGPALYVAGNFSPQGDPVRRENITKWDGERWWALHGGVGSTVRSLAVFDDGSGLALFVGGGFGEAGLIEANNIAKWQGCNYQPLCEPEWAALGGGITSDIGFITTLGSFNDGSGPLLFVSGTFFEADGVEALNFAKWDGTQWSHGGLDWRVHDFTVFDDGSGPALYAGGDLFMNNDFTQTFVWRWDGAQWSPYGSGFGRATGAPQGRSVHALAVFDDGSGPALYAGGDFTTAGGEDINMVAKWDGEKWVALGAGFNDPTTAHQVNSMIVHDDGSGPALYVGGTLPGVVGIEGASMNHIARWDGQNWSALGDGLFAGPILVLEVFDSGNGPELYAGGGFSSIVGVADTRYIAKWDGQQWLSITPQIAGSVHDMAVWDDGTGGGPALYVGGGFRSVDYKETGEIAKWDGTNWWGIRDGVDRGSSALNSVSALAVHDDGLGHGPVLYVGGRFLTTTEGLEVNRIAKYGCGLGFAGPDVPALDIAIAPSGQLRITWPQDNRLWILESASTPTASQGSPVDADVGDQGGQLWGVERPMDGQAEFFWLRLVGSPE